MLHQVFLTGATGTIGSAILAVLISSGAFAVDCLVRDAHSRHLVEKVGGRAVIGDMGDEALFLRLSAATTYDFILHTAQLRSSNASAGEVDTLDAKAVENLQRLCSARTRCMIYTSGVWIYGHQTGANRITEATPLRPFQRARARAARVTALLAQTEFPWVQICPPNMVYGSVGPLISIARSLREQPMEIIDDERVLWSVIERVDLARAYLAVLQRGQRKGFYLVAEDEPVSSVAFYESVAAAVPGASLVRRPRDYFAAVSSPERMETLYGNQPVVPAWVKASTGWSARECFTQSVRRFLV